MEAAHKSARSLMQRLTHARMHEGSRTHACTRERNRTCARTRARTRKPTPNSVNVTLARGTAPLWQSHIRVCLCGAEVDAERGGPPARLKSHATLHQKRNVVLQSQSRSAGRHDLTHRVSDYRQPPHSCTPKVATTLAYATRSYSNALLRNVIFNSYSS
eukprot:3023589-Pleurochrysis_carterae.AAC.2